MSKRKKSRIAQLRLRKKLRRNTTRLVLRALAWMGFAIIYYISFSLLFDTPYEIYLKHSSQKLRAEYTALESRFDSLDMVVSNLEERDHSIFHALFESEPYSVDGDNNRSTSCELLTTEELIAEFDRRTTQLEMSVDSLVVSTQNMLIAIDQKGKEVARIPAIQPIANRQLTLLSASFGMRIHPFYKKLQPHHGVDYALPEGTRVFATADGVIKEYTLSSNTSGKSILIDHGNGYETYYAHLGKIDIPRSRRVKRGGIIGMSGNTGLSITPHLHYEVRYKGEAVDPINYFFMELTPSQSLQMRRIAEAGMQAFD